MQKQTKILMGALFLLVLTLSLTSAMVVKSVEASNFQPGSEQAITLEIKNTLDEDAEDVSVVFDLTGLPFSTIGIEDNPDEISEDDKEDFDFKLKATGSAKAGDYQIPYTIYYTMNGTRYPTIDSVTKTIPKTGTFTLTVEAEPQLVYSVNTDTPIVGSKGKITLKIVNKGLGDAKFVSVTLIPSGYTLLSGETTYIGTISSDDSQNENFEVIFTQPNPTLTAQVEYRNFNNELITKTINLPVTVYTQEQALKLGITSKNNTGIYIALAAVVIIGWIIIRKVRKKRRLNKAQGR
jgi:hypothetical protein